MGTAGGCQLCPSVRRRRRGNHQHRDDPVQWCEQCRAYVCGRHIVWHVNRWLCTGCARHV